MSMCTLHMCTKNESHSQDKNSKTGTNVYGYGLRGGASTLEELSQNGLYKVLSHDTLTTTWD